MTSARTAHLDALAAWDTPALSNALDALRLRPCGTGHTDGSIYRISGGAAGDRRQGRTDPRRGAEHRPLV